MTNNTSGEPNTVTVRVTAVHKERYELLWGETPLFGRLKTSVYLGGGENYPTVGDNVWIQHNDQGDSVIIKTGERKSFFSRLDPDANNPREQAVAANFDYVFIIASLNHDFNPRRMERYLAQAWQSGAPPVLILSKADLVPDHANHVNTLENIAPGTDIIPVSAVTGYGLDKLEKYLQPGHTVVFLGSSGVGKSSLLNALAGKDLMRVNTIREDDSKGRHTTTHRQMLALPGGAMVIDTPGMRSLGMWDADAGIGGAFADVEGLMGSCKFSDCRHANEPGCAVRAAVQDGTLSQERLDSYHKLKRETAYVDNKAAFMQAKSERNKNIAQWGRKNKNEKYKRGY